MKIFLDTANIELIKKYNDMGLVDGITTNPTLLSKEKGNPAEIMREIVKIVKGPVSLEVIGTRMEEMVNEAHGLKKYGQNVVVKIPMIPDGLKVVKKLKEEGIQTNVTLIFSANQAILAAKAGAAYVISEIVQIFKNYQFNTDVLVASIRHPLHVTEAGKIGAQVVTLPPDILGKMISHPLTDKGLSAFLSDWEKVKKENPNLVI
jgi:transaldolase